MSGAASQRTPLRRKTCLTEMDKLVKKLEAHAEKHGYVFKKSSLKLNRMLEGEMRCPCAANRTCPCEESHEEIKGPWGSCKCSLFWDPVEYERKHG